MGGAERQKSGSGPRPPQLHSGEKSNSKRTLDSTKETDSVDLTANSSPLTNKRRKTGDKDKDNVVPKRKDKQKVRSTQVNANNVIKNRRNDPPGPGKPITLMTCCVCLESPEKCAVTSCGHLYCTDCIYKALTSSSKATKHKGVCSICRRQLNYSEVIYLEMRQASGETAPVVVEDDSASGTSAA